MTDEILQEIDKETIHLLVFITQYLENTHRKQLALEVARVVINDYIGKGKFDRLVNEVIEDNIAEDIEPTKENGFLYEGPCVANGHKSRRYHPCKKRSTAGYLCTRITSHKGDHMAHTAGGTGIILRWKQ